MGVLIKIKAVTLAGRQLRKLRISTEILQCVALDEREVHFLAGQFRNELPAASFGVGLHELSINHVLGKGRRLHLILELIPGQLRVAEIRAKGKLLRVFLGHVFDQFLIQHSAKAVAHQALAIKLILNFPTREEDAYNAATSKAFEHVAHFQRHLHAAAAEVLRGHLVHF